MNWILQDCAAGKISPEIAVAHFLFHGQGAAAIADELARAAPHPQLDAMRALLRGREAQLDALSTHVAATVTDHHAHGATPAEGIARIASFFDRAVAASPEASVALYSLGDGAILGAATAELVQWLDARGLLAGAPDVVDLGCGIGRVGGALSGRCRSVLGLDVSARMVDEARRRHAGIGNLRFEVTSGEDLAMLGDASCDLILAIDTFPYVIQTGPAVVARHLDDAYRALRPGGALALLNVSYEQGDDDADLARRFADAHGFALDYAAPQPFRLWDGSACVLRR